MADAVGGPVSPTPLQRLEDMLEEKSWVQDGVKEGKPILRFYVPVSFKDGRNPEILVITTYHMDPSDPRIDHYLRGAVKVALTAKPEMFNTLFRPVGDSQTLRFRLRAAQTGGSAGDAKELGFNVILSDGTVTTLKGDKYGTQVALARSGEQYYVFVALKLDEAYDCVAPARGIAQSVRRLPGRLVRGAVGSLLSRIPGGYGKSLKTKVGITTVEEELAKAAALRGRAEELDPEGELRDEAIADMFGSRALMLRHLRDT